MTDETGLSKYVDGIAALLLVFGLVWGMFTVAFWIVISCHAILFGDPLPSLIDVIYGQVIFVSRLKVI